VSDEAVADMRANGEPLPKLVVGAEKSRQRKSERTSPQEVECCREESFGDQMNLLIKGNSKMGTKVYIFNLPPHLTCKPTQWCLKGRNGKPACYARRNNFKLPSVKDATMKRYRASKRKDFVEKMLDELQRIKPQFFRWHSGGDFYSDEYVEKVGEIVKNTPGTLFRTTTRRRDLSKSILKLAKLSNMIVRESLDAEFPKPTMGLPVAALSHLPIARGMFLCPNDCDICGHHCWQESCDMCFEEH